MIGHDNDIVLELSKTPDAPLVMLFGWAGCKDRYLAKYSAMYQNAGQLQYFDNMYSVLRYTVDFGEIISYQSYKKYAYLIYERVLRTNNFPSIVMHAFSMNGGSVVGALWQLFDTVDGGEKLKGKVAGIIFDSAPAYTGFYRLSRARSLAFCPPQKYGIIIHLLYRIISLILCIFYNGYIWLESLVVKNTYAKYYCYCYLCEAHDLPKKQLIIYSNSDIICLPDSIHSYIAKQKLCNVDVKYVEFPDSPHCEHFRFHQEEYTKSCMEFVHSCLSRSSLILT
uniref:Transmembrane protein 53 n=1 Tax=Syphacia muris TaxID=451379 RepID=A0A0N5B0C3_9BILA